MAVFFGLLAVYLGGYQVGQTPDLTVEPSQTKPVTQDAPMRAQLAELSSLSEQSNLQLEATNPEDIDPASIDWKVLRKSRDAKGIGIPDFSRQLVTAHDLYGKATGEPVSDMVFPSHVLAAKCKQIEKDLEKAKKKKGEERALDDWTWAAEAAAMNPAITIAMNQRYGYGFGNRWYRSPGACWGTSTGVMCQPY